MNEGALIAAGEGGFEVCDGFVLAGAEGLCRGSHELVQWLSCGKSGEAASQCVVGRVGFVEEGAQGVELQEHVGGELLEAFRREEGDPLGAGFRTGFGIGAGLENAAAFPVFARGDPFLGLEDVEGGPERVAADLEIGGEGAFSGQQAAEFAIGDHFLQNISRLGR